MKHDSQVSTGIDALDDMLQSLRLGDNVVWQIDRLEDYARLSDALVNRAIADGRACYYVRFAPHPPVLEPRPGLTVIPIDPSPGFGFFSVSVHGTITRGGLEAFYVFDNLSALVDSWATDELLANFFQVTCPYLAELDTVAYFALTRGRHAHSAVARIRDTTQLLVDLYHVEDDLYVHPLKVWDRYSTQMFLPHRFADGQCTPVFQSGQAASVTALGRRDALLRGERSIAPWDSVYRRLASYREQAPDDAEMPPEIEALKSELTRMMIADTGSIYQLADRYLTLDDLFAVRARLVGSGRIGGKAAGMLIARAILRSDEESGAEFAEALEPHDSFYIGSDVFFTFLVNNDLFRLRLNLSRRDRLDASEFEEVERRFLEGTFPPTSSSSSG